MNNESKESKRPIRNITWLAAAPPARCEHEYEIVAQEYGDDVKKCAKCGRVEAE